MCVFITLNDDVVIVIQLQSVIAFGCFRSCVMEVLMNMMGVNKKPPAEVKMPSDGVFVTAVHNFSFLISSFVGYRLKMFTVAGLIFQKLLL